jgi:hypothetical protein
MHLNRPTLFLNDTPQSPFFYALTDVPGGRWSWEEVPQHNIRQFVEQGVTLFQFDLALDFVWFDDGSFNVEAAQKQIRGVLDVCPQAAVFLRLHVRPPKWWMKKYPEENTTYFGSESMPDIERGFLRLLEEDAANPTRTSLASQKWRDECEPIVRRFCEEFSKRPKVMRWPGFKSRAAFTASGITGASSATNPIPALRCKPFSRLVGKEVWRCEQSPTGMERQSGYVSNGDGS